MRTRLLVISLIALSAVVAACGGGGGQLTGTTWQLTAVTEKVPAFQGVVPADQQPHYAITFNSDGSFNASADCNQLNGTYTTSGSSMTITPGAMTMAFCGEESLDTLFVHALGNVASFAIANNQLTLTTKSEGTLVFSPAASGASTGPDAPASAEAPASAAADATGGLLGKAWQLTAVTEKVPAFQGVIPDADQANYTITFNADGTFNAQADCNNVAGTYTTADPAAASGDLSIFPGPSTLAYCGDGSFGDLFTIGLGSAASYAVDAEVLTITLVNDGTLTFK
jgi:heat shock protein HslJ